MDSDTAKSYEYLFRKNLLTLSDAEVQNIINKLNYRPKFTILIEHDKENIKSVVESIQEQLYTDYEIIIFSQDEK